jgi:hypothetical protein
MMKKRLFLIGFLVLLILGTSSSVLSELPVDKLVAHWSFDEGQVVEGTSTKDVVNGFKGQMGDADWVDGKIGKALEFDGEKSFVSVADEAELKDFPEGLTVEAWVMLKGPVDEFSAVILRKHPEYTLEVLGQLVARATVNGLWAAEWLTGKTKMEQDIWYHLAMTCNTDKRMLYVSGEVEDEKAGVVLNPTGSPLGIGKNVSQEMYFFPGIIDEVKIWGIALTADQIAESMEGESGPKAVESRNKLATNWGVIKKLKY